MSSAEAGQCVSLALKRVKRAVIRKGMVIVHKSDTPPRGNLIHMQWTTTDTCDICSNPSISGPGAHFVVRVTIIPSAIRS